MSWIFAEAWLLLLPLAAFWWRVARPTDDTGSVGVRLRRRLATRHAIGRLIVPVVGIAALAHPVVSVREPGADLVIVVDRSASMSATDRRGAREVVELAERARSQDCRVGIVTFGRTATVERPPLERESFAGFSKEVHDSGSDLENGLSTALRLFESERPGRILVLSDGEFTGLDPLAEGWRAASRGIPIDFRHFARATGRDVAVADLRLPRRVLPGEGFQFTATVLSDAVGPCHYTLTRDGVPLSSGETRLRAGENDLIFRDRGGTPGTARYRLALTAEGDQIPQNDTGFGVVLIEGEAPILLLCGIEGEGNLARALRSSGREVEVRVAGEVELTRGDLLSRPLVVLENVLAADFRRSELRALAHYVENAGGGLLVTGGRRSFGIGGYYKSPLEKTLPVSLELRQEARKLRVAVAFVLDRSGSMGANVGFSTKMDLANQGCVAAVDLLTPLDEASVSAIDSAPHRVIDMAALGDKSDFTRKVLGIDAGGGGIFVHVGLVAGAEELSRSTAGTRHLILFADAADAEEPGPYLTTIEKLRAAGITISVIALGEESDTDADLLKDIALAGGGSIHFTTDATTLPQLFGMETINISKAAFVSETTEVVSHAAFATMGESSWPDFPSVGGYNLVYARDGAQTGLTTADEFEAPLFAFWQPGLGRCAVYTGEADGTYTGAFGNWKDYDAFFATTANWLAGVARPADLATNVDRREDVVTVTVEFDPEEPTSRPTSSPVLHVLPDEPDRESFAIPMAWTSPDTMTATYRLLDSTVHHHRILVGDRVARAAPASLPYNPEFASRVGKPGGRATLEELSRRSGGKERAVMDSGLFDVVAARSTLYSLAIPLTWLFLILSVLEIAARRLGFGRFQWRRRGSGTRAAADESAGTVLADTPITSRRAPKRDASVAEEAARENEKIDAMEVLREAKRRSR